jgi:hypothetical protein
MPSTLISPPEHSPLISALLAQPDPARKYSPHTPHARQQAFLALDCEEAFYGGAAGGGKSDAILMAALQYVDVPGYAALILRKTFAQLHKSNAIMARAQEWLTRTDARWNGEDHAFVFPSGARLEFGHLQYSKDRFNYQGAEYQYVGFDELTQFDQDDYLYLHSRVRKPESGPLARIPLRVRGAGNPGGTGHHWVRSRFIKREPQQDETESPAEGKRLFVPAKLPDNPSIDQASYEAQLQNLDARTRKQLLDGNWDVREPGACFDEFDWDKNTIEGTRQFGSPYPVVRALDWGHQHMPVLWIEVQGSQAFVFDEWHGIKTLVPDVVNDMRRIDQDHGLDTSELPTYVDPAGIGTNYQTGETDVSMLRSLGFTVVGEDERFGRETRTGLIKVMLERGQLWISRDRCPYLIDCLERAVWERHGVEGALKDTYKKHTPWDHHLDALGEALVRLFPPEGSPSAVETAVDVIGPWTEGFYSSSEFG